MAGNTRSEATANNDRGPVPDSFPMQMILQLRLPPDKEHELEQLIQDLEDPKSPEFHNWLTGDQFRQQFSVAPQDIEAIASWLQSYGFTINFVYPRSIDFSGTAGQVRKAFRTEIHDLEVNGEKHFGNMSDPQIPTALAPAVVGVVSLHNFMPRPMNTPRSQYTAGGGSYLVVPADLATIYNLNPLFSTGISGQGQTIVLLEDSDVYSTADWSTFRTTLGLSGFKLGSFSQVHPAPGSAGTCTDPGPTRDDGEATLDVEWASAGAPNAAIVLASCASSTNFGAFTAMQNLISASGTPPAIMSLSYGAPEEANGAASNAYVNSLYQQAVSEGVSVFVSSGDEGAASSDAGANTASHGITISIFTSTIYDVSVGGTDFGDTYAGTNSTYWNATNSAAFGSALSYIPEIPWNDSCASVLLATYVGGNGTTYGLNGFCNSTTAKNDGFVTVVGGSGGPSGCATGAPSNPGVVSGTCAGYPKPSWQTVFGNPNDGVRDIPDVSLFAANGLWGHYYVVCYSDPGRGLGGAPCTGAPSTWSGFGGTSIAAPIMASFQALVNQNTGSSWGNPNPTYYSLANTEYGASGNSSCNSSLGNGVASTCVFYDVTQGDMDVPCTGGVNCYLPSGSNGVLSTGPAGSAIVTAAGSGYSSAPACTISAPSNQAAYSTYSGGAQATCRATLTNGAVSAISITNGGAGYAGNPACTLSGGGGSGAACTAAAGTSTAYQPTFGAAVGWDFATGIGTVNASNLVNRWPTTYKVAATSGTPQITTLDTAFQNALVVTVTSGGSPASGVQVTFNAPSSGASGTFAGGANTATTNASGVATSPAFTANGTVGVYTVTTSVSGATATVANFSLRNTAASGDFSGDGKADIAVWRPSNGTWYAISNSNPNRFLVQQWGAFGDIPARGDYDGDGKTDFAVFRPSNGTWFIIPSGNPGNFIVQQWGTSGDIPVPGDYDGDGKTDFAVFRPSNGTWYIIPTSNPSSPIVQQWGTNADIPVPGDYDGDGKTDFAVFRPSNGTWYIIPTSNPSRPIVQQWGTNGDIPVPGDYDGNGKTDFAVFRPSDGTWFIIPSSNPGAPIIQQWGTMGDIPVPVDYDRDRKTDIAVWRPSSGNWFIIPSSAPSTYTITQWGTNGDVPVQKPIGQ